MTITTTNHSYKGVNGEVAKVSQELPSLKPKEILLKITHTGVCGSDIHMVDIGSALGHEGVGVVQAIGSEVTQFKLGDRAGGGYLRNSCGHCQYCLSSDEIWCLDRDIYWENSYSTDPNKTKDRGTFADYYIGEETYLHKIPDAISSEHAAPLQCAGATVYSVIIDNVKPGQRVGVIGIGGLGHLAIQFAAKLGFEVVAFSTTMAKEKEAKEFGASEFVLVQEPSKISKPVDVLIVTGIKAPEWNNFMDSNVVSRRGVVVMLTPEPSMNFPGMNWITHGYTVTMSQGATKNMHQDMLVFAAQHSIKPTFEQFPFSKAGIDDAFGKLKNGTMRYRGVLVAA